MSEIREFDPSTAVRGQEVTQEVYEHFLNVLPPIRLKGGQGWYAGFQMSEPYCHRGDKRLAGSKCDTWRAMYMTFTASGNRYFYQGINFAGEVDSREFVEGE